MRTKTILGIMVVSLFFIGLLGACGSRNASDVSSVSDVQDNAVSRRYFDLTKGDQGEIESLKL